MGCTRLGLYFREFGRLIDLPVLLRGKSDARRHVVWVPGSNRAAARGISSQPGYRAEVAKSVSRAAPTQRSSRTDIERLSEEAGRAFSELAARHPNYLPQYLMYGNLLRSDHPDAGALVALHGVGVRGLPEVSAIPYPA